MLWLEKDQWHLFMNRWRMVNREVREMLHCSVLHWWHQYWKSFICVLFWCQCIKKVTQKNYPKAGENEMSERLKECNLFILPKQRWVLTGQFSDDKCQVQREICDLTEKRFNRGQVQIKGIYLEKLQQITKGKQWTVRLFKSKPDTLLKNMLQKIQIIFINLQVKKGTGRNNRTVKTRRH